MRCTTVPEEMVDQAIEKIQQVAQSYHRLVIIAAPSGSGKTAVLRELSTRLGFPWINVNLEVSRGFMNLTARQRAMQLPAVLGDVVANSPGEVILLDNIEILFDPALQQDPLRHFQGISRNRTVVVAWPGATRRDDRGQVSLTYAVPGHPEYRRYPVADLVLVELSATP